MERDRALIEILEKMKDDIVNLNDNIQSRVIDEISRAYNTPWLKSFDLESEFQDGETYKQVAEDRVEALVREYGLKWKSKKAHSKYIVFEEFVEPENHKCGHMKQWNSGWRIPLDNKRREYEKKAVQRGFGEEWNSIAAMVTKTVEKSLNYYENEYKELILRHALKDVRTAIQSIIATESPSQSAFYHIKRIWEMGFFVGGLHIGSKQKNFFLYYRPAQE